MTTVTSQQRRAPIRDRLLIGGELIAGEGERLAVVDPATEEEIAQVASASPSQAEAALRAARTVADRQTWSGISPAERSRALHRFADAFEARIDELIATVVSEVGTPISLADSLQVGSALSHFRHYADLAARELERDLGPAPDPPSHSVLGWRAAGVAVGITAYNYPLMLAASKVGAALAAGCATILLPSPQTPLSSLALAEMALEAELPAGALSVLVGGPEVGAALTSDSRVDRVSFTGSVDVGRTIMRQCATHVTGVVLELGGKSPDIVLPDFRLDDESVMGIHARYLRNAGQGCASPTRLLVHQDAYSEFVEVSRRVYETVAVGDPWSPATLVGPLISAAHRSRVEGFIERALAAGGTIVAGGGRPPGRGWFVNPTLIADVAPDSEVAQEEIFGPVGVLLPYRDLDDAVEIANGTRFGLAAYVHGDEETARGLAPRLRAGTVYINGGGGLRPDAPFGGWGASGIGREWGEHGIREFLEPQHIQWRLADAG
jgi:aldehyde dehydrogenase (NAD+)/betaine-aldehyde dehydrogenase